eukprot:Lankesteria_metandrocarpae@DN5457_c0_g2_i1.p1
MQKESCVLEVETSPADALVGDKSDIQMPSASLNFETVASSLTGDKEKQLRSVDLVPETDEFPQMAYSYSKRGCGNVMDQKPVLKGASDTVPESTGKILNSATNPESCEGEEDRRQLDPSKDQSVKRVYSEELETTSRAKKNSGDEAESSSPTRHNHRKNEDSASDTGRAEDGDDDDDDQEVSFRSRTAEYRVGAHRRGYAEQTKSIQRGRSSSNSSVESRSGGAVSVGAATVVDKETGDDHRRRRTQERASLSPRNRGNRGSPSPDDYRSKRQSDTRRDDQVLRNVSRERRGGMPDHLADDSSKNRRHNSSHTSYNGNNDSSRNNDSNRHRRGDTTLSPESRRHHRNSNNSYSSSTGGDDYRPRGSTGRNSRGGDNLSSGASRGDNPSTYSRAGGDYHRNSDNSYNRDDENKRHYRGDDRRYSQHRSGTGTEDFQHRERYASRGSPVHEAKRRRRGSSDDVEDSSESNNKDTGTNKDTGDADTNDKNNNGKHSDADEYSGGTVEGRQKYSQRKGRRGTSSSLNHSRREKLDDDRRQQQRRDSSSSPERYAAAVKSHGDGGRDDDATTTSVDNSTSAVHRRHNHVAKHSRVRSTSDASRSPSDSSLTGRHSYSPPAAAKGPNDNIDDGHTSTGKERSKLVGDVETQMKDDRNTTQAERSRSSSGSGSSSNRRHSKHKGSTRDSSLEGSVQEERRGRKGDAKNRKAVGDAISSDDNEDSSSTTGDGDT